MCGACWSPDCCGRGSDPWPKAARSHGGFFFTAVPGRPTGVTLLEAVKDYMVLGWTAPADDGGADVRGYFVDYRTVKGDVVGKWHEMNHQALTTTSYKVRRSSRSICG